MGSDPIGVVLAGGRGRRLGGAKATALLQGRPLISYPLAALTQVLEEVVVLAKETTPLPSLPTTTVWIEREARQHPLIGLLEALTRANGRPVLVCALDLPLVTPQLVKKLASEPERPATIAAHKNEIQPLLGYYRPEAIGPLRRAGTGVPLKQAVTTLWPGLFETENPEVLTNVNTPADLERAAELLSRRSRTSSAPAE
jgi:molybdopterin-guanine dinucleotide biosynthesis protein A